ncbi:alkyl sulfatase C-terminal domain-containing protein [Kitasatospora sp. NPDC050467]|uniref:alkyl sulfatase C-terminal domain-containing protein n=1 Tax=unclassified Kitasatospora TaxID=2633591 RepID=UPI0037874BF3
MLLDSLAIRVDGPRAWAEDLTIDLVLTDEERRYRLTLHNGVLTHRSCPAAPARARETGAAPGRRPSRGRGRCRQTLDFRS